MGPPSGNTQAKEHLPNKKTVRCKSQNQRKYGHSKGTRRKSAL